MTGLLVDARLRWDHAQKRHAELERRIMAFIHEKPYIRQLYFDDKSGHIFEEISLNPIPTDITILTGEAILHLRASLDIAIFSLFGATKIIQPDRHAKFPIRDCERQLKGDVAFNKLPKDIQPFILGLKPYRGGNDCLWALNNLCNTDKHRQLIPSIIGSRTKIISGDNASSGISNTIYRNQNKIVYYVEYLDKPRENETEIVLAVAFGEVEVVKGQPVLAVLDNFACVVDSILLGFEAEARRLGYI